MNELSETKSLLITGGTGSFGKSVLEKFLPLESIEEIRIFSRDEKKQEEIREMYPDKKISFFIGDVRDTESINTAIRGVDLIFHAAALKQVPSCEFHPTEALKTNAIGTSNVLESAINNNVKKVVCLSTDKAVYPINAMGISKALMEKIMIAKSREAQDLGASTVICATRYGNVMASRGSVIPLFVSQLLDKKPITVTDQNMTRFMMTLDDAVELVEFAFNNCENGDIFVQKAPSVTIETLYLALLELFDVSSHPVNVIGTRHGEKLYETLLSREEKIRSSDMGDYFKISPDVRSLYYSKYKEDGEKDITFSEDFNSHNAKMLDVEGMKTMLLKLPLITQALN